MPEGDTLYKIASRLDAIARGERVEEVETPLPALVEGGLEGQAISCVEARGKHLLIHFSDARVLHSHLRREGSWHIIAKGAPWPKPKHRLTLALVLKEHTLAGFSVPTLALLKRSELLNHPHLNALGPDLLSPSPDLAEIIARLRRHPTRAIAEAIMDQRNCAGIGNVYKSELLFLQRLHPCTALSAIDDEQLRGLLADAIKWMRRNLFAGKRRTRWGNHPSHWVYNKAGQRCGVCDALIARLRQGALNRSTYFCPRCQPSPKADALGKPSSLLRDY